MNGYTVEEAARVLGIPTERVWDLVARGVFSGARGDDGTWRVHLGGSPAHRSTATPQRSGAPNAQRDGQDPAATGAGAELSPFRELLTEFRHLTERYGQALLALGEARGEVAALTSRVSALEARVDLRLPYAGLSQSTAQLMPAADAGTDDVGEPVSAVVAAPPPVELEEPEAEATAEPEASVSPDASPEAAASLTPDGPMTAAPEVEAAAETDVPAAEAEVGAASAAEAVAPTAEEAAPVAEEGPPVAEEAAPVAEEVEAVAETVEAVPPAAEEAAQAAEAEAVEAEEAEARAESEVEAAAMAAELDELEVNEPPLPDEALPSGELPTSDEEFETIDDLLVLAGDEEEVEGREATAELAEPETAATAEAATEPAEGEAEAAITDNVEPETQVVEPAEVAADASVEPAQVEATEPEPVSEGDAQHEDLAAFGVEGQEPAQPRRNHRLGSEIAAALARADDPSPPELPSGGTATESISEPIGLPAASGEQPAAVAAEREQEAEPALVAGRTVAQVDDEAEYIAEMEIGSAGWQRSVTTATIEAEAAAPAATEPAQRDLAMDPYPDQNELINALGWEQDEVDAIRSLLAGQASIPGARAMWPSSDPDARPADSGSAAAAARAEPESPALPEARRGVTSLGRSHIRHEPGSEAPGERPAERSAGLVGIPIEEPAPSESSVPDETASDIGEASEPAEAVESAEPPEPHEPPEPAEVTEMTETAAPAEATEAVEAPVASETAASAQKPDTPVHEPPAEPDIRAEHEMPGQQAPPEAERDVRAEHEMPGQQLPREQAAPADTEGSASDERPWPIADRPARGETGGGARLAPGAFELPGSADLDAALEALRRRSSEEAAAEEGTAEGARRGEVTIGHSTGSAVQRDEGRDESREGSEAAAARPPSGFDEAAWSRRSPAANAYRRLRRFLGG